MTKSASMLDRLRIERATWSLDARLQDLPRRSRITKRRELRENLRAASQDVGSRQAIRQLGDLRVLAAEYLAAEYGELARRPSWTAAAVALFVVDGAMLLISQVTTAAFTAGVTAAAPHASGTFHWRGVRYLISDQTFTFSGGKSTSLGGAWTPWVYLLMLVSVVLAGRLWRLLPALRRRALAGSAA
jgi:hypothetical protein